MRIHGHLNLLNCVALAGTLLVAGCASPLHAQAPKRALVVTTTVGFRHDSIPTAEKILGELARTSGLFTVDYARLDPKAPEFKGADGRPDKAKYFPAVAAVLAEKMSPAALKQYDLVIFANTTGDLPLPDKAAFLDWIKSGKGFVGIHSAADTYDKTGDYPGYPPYIEMLGGEFKTHGPQVAVDAINQDPQFPGCRHLPADWQVFDEIYQFKNFERAKVHGLLTLDQHPNNKTPGDYPIAWIKEYREGPRVLHVARASRGHVGSRTGRTATASAGIPPKFPGPTSNICWAASSGRWGWKKPTPNRSSPQASPSYATESPRR